MPQIRDGIDLNEDGIEIFCHHEIRAVQLEIVLDVSQIVEAGLDNRANAVHHAGINALAPHRLRSDALEVLLELLLNHHVVGREFGRPIRVRLVLPLDGVIRDVNLLAEVIQIVLGSAQFQIAIAVKPDIEGVQIHGHHEVLPDIEFGVVDEQRPLDVLLHDECLRAELLHMAMDRDFVVEDLHHIAAMAVAGLDNPQIAIAIVFGVREVLPYLRGHHPNVGQIAFDLHRIIQLDLRGSIHHLHVYLPVVVSEDWWIDYLGVVDRTIDVVVLLCIDR